MVQWRIQWEGGQWGHIEAFITLTFIHLKRVAFVVQNIFKTFLFEGQILKSFQSDQILFLLAT